MSKEVYIALIQKDIKELDVIAQGLYETDFPSPTVIKLASSKAMDIVNNLQRLSTVKQEESKAEKEEQERLAAEAKAKAEREEQERLAAEAKAKAEKEEQERLAAEAKAKAEKEEQERLAAEERAKALLSDHNKQSIIEEKIGNVESKVEQMSKEAGDSMADKIASSRITTIKSAISIADRFRFQRELFGGNADLMNSTLDKLDACDSIEQAEDIVNDFTEWNPEDENVKEFLKLLGRRF